MMLATLEIILKGHENDPWNRTKKIELTQGEIQLIHDYPHWDNIKEIMGDRINDEIIFIKVIIPFDENSEILYNLNEDSKLSGKMIVSKVTKGC